MQNAITASPLFQLLIGFVAGAGGLAGIYKLFLERKKPKADEASIHLSNAQTEKTLAEAHKIILDDAIRAHGEAKERIQELEARLKEVPRLEESNKLLTEQNEQMKYVLKLHKIKYDGSDERQGNGKSH